MSLKSDGDDVVSGNIGVVGDAISAVAVVDDLGSCLRAIGVADLDGEVIATIVAWFSVLVDGVDGEDTGFVIEQLLQSGSFGVGVVGISGLLDVWVERRVLDGLSVEVDVDLVVSGSSDAVFNVVGSVSVVLNAGVNILGSSDGHIEGIATGGDLVAIGIDSVDSEVKWVIGLSSVKSRAFGVGLGGVTLLDEWVEGRSLDVLSAQSDGDGVESRGIRDVATSVCSVSVVVEVDVDGSGVVANDLDVVRVVSGGDGLSVLILGHDGEGSVLTDSGSFAFNTRARGGCVVSVGSRDVG